MTDALARSLTTQCSQLSSKMERAHAQLEHKFNANNLTQETVVNELRSSMAQQFDHVANEIKASDTKFASKYASQDEQIQENHTIVTGLCSRLDQKLAASSDELNDKLTNQMKRSQVHCGDLDRRFTQQCAEVDRSWSAELKRVSLELTQKLSSQGEEQQALAKQNADTLLELAAKLATVTSNMDHKIGHNHTINREAIVAIKNELKECHNHFTDICFTLDKTQAANLRGLQKQIAANFETANDAVASLGVAVDQQLSTLLTRMTDTDSAVASRCDASNRAIQDHYQHFTDIYSKLAKQSEEQSSEQAKQHLIEQQRIIANIDKLGLRCKDDIDRLMDIVVRDYESVNSKIAEVTSAADNIHTALANSQKQGDQALHAKVDDAKEDAQARLDSLNLQLTALISSGQSKAEADVRKVEHNLSRCVEDCVERLQATAAGIEIRVDEEHRQWSIAVDTLSSREAAAREKSDAKFAEICTALDRKLLDTAAAQAERWATSFNSSDIRIDSLETGCQKASEDFATKLSEHNTRIIEALNASVGEVRSWATTGNQQLEDKIANLRNEAGEQFSEIESALASNSLDIRNATTDFERELDQRINRENALFSELASKLDWKSSEHARQLSSEISSLKHAVGIDMRAQLQSLDADLRNTIEFKMAEMTKEMGQGALTSKGGTS